MEFTNRITKHLERMNPDTFQNSRLAILLLAFSRPEKLVRRLEELGKLNPNEVYVSIDGGSSQKVTDEFHAIEQKFRTIQPQIDFQFHKDNLGLVGHMSGAISKLMLSHEYVLVIEDDVPIGEKYVESIRNAIIAGLGDKVATYGGFSPFTGHLPFPYKAWNGWRRTKYFSAWGWCISRNIWELYKVELCRDKLHSELQNSKRWNSLSAYQKKTWMRRFEKVAINPKFTWDYQMQYMSFKHDLDHILPIFRISDHEGFGDERSTNTKSGRPRWMGEVVKISDNLVVHRVPKTLSKLLEIVDSLTIGGDSKFKEFFSKARRRQNLRFD